MTYHYPIWEKSFELKDSGVQCSVLKSENGEIIITLGEGKIEIGGLDIPLLVENVMKAIIEDGKECN